MKKLKFVGDYNELKNHGFEFQKLYASNYRQWCKEIDPNNHIRVWKKGDEIEINDFYGLSGAVADFVLKHDPVDLSGPGSRLLFKDGYWGLKFTLDRVNNTAIPYDKDRHFDTLYFMAEEGTLNEEAKSKLIPGYTYKDFVEHFRVVILSPEVVEAVRELFTLRMAEIVEVEDTEEVA